MYSQFDLLNMRADVLWNMPPDVMEEVLARIEEAEDIKRLEDRDRKIDRAKAIRAALRSATASMEMAFDMATSAKTSAERAASAAKSIDEQVLKLPVAAKSIDEQVRNSPVAAKSIDEQVLNLPVAPKSPEEQVLKLTRCSDVSRQAALHEALSAARSAATRAIAAADKARDAKWTAINVLPEIQQAVSLAWEAVAYVAARRVRKEANAARTKARAVAMAAERAAEKASQLGMRTTPRIADITDVEVEPTAPATPTQQPESRAAYMCVYRKNRTQSRKFYRLLAPIILRLASEFGVDVEVYPAFCAPSIRQDKSTEANHRRFGRAKSDWSEKSDSHVCATASDQIYLAALSQLPRSVQQKFSQQFTPRCNKK